ncbi:hypothetical protein [Sphingobium sp. EM0848]|uniref:hypothetical protein n=1 Tax=Sphingobium sp. EM0848 TaxID=2743473 RepID=UPI00159C7E11|nr:hypothetical protein [Sphingobium sp. EM0848]
MTPHFARYAVIDWSGAKGSRHKGIAVALCEAGDGVPTLQHPEGGGFWSRQAVARAVSD